MFITLEGPDGSGKSCQIPPLAEYLRQKGYEVLTTREPGGTAIGDQVRQVIMSMKNTEMDPRTEILLFCSARAQLVEQVIRPALAQGMIVLSDRYADSTLAYQGYGHRLDLGILNQILDFATGGLKPDLTLLLDVDVEEGIRRKHSNGSEWNRLDAYDVEFHKRVREGYHKLVAENPARWKIINAGAGRDLVQSSIRQVVEQTLANH
jgi:dTMP kinase